MKYLIVPIRAMKRREKDTYEHGCDPDSTQQHELDLPSPGECIVKVMSELVGKKLQREHVYTFDPNIYCDVKDGGARVVDDRSGRGYFRVEHDRSENGRGREVTSESKEWPDFVAGRIHLYHAVYELHFHIRLVGLEEADLAKYLNVTNHS